MLLNDKKTQARCVSIFVTSILVIAIISGCANQGNAAASQAIAVMATYKGGSVTREELDKYIGAISFFNEKANTSRNDPNFQEYAVKQIIMSKVMVSRASGSIKKAAEVKVKAQLEQMNNLSKDQKASLDQRLKHANTDLKNIEAYIRSNEVIMGDAAGKVTDQELKFLFYTKQKKDPNAFDFATVDSILIAYKDPTDSSGKKELRTKDAALKIAGDVRNQLAAGGDFAILAKKYSDDAGSKNTGKYDNQPVSHWESPFKKAVMSLPLNTISDPVESHYGYYIIKVESRSAKNYDEAKASLIPELAQTHLDDFIIMELPQLDYKSNIS